MNVSNNRRRRESREKMEKVFIRELQSKEISQITVSDICKQTGLNRSTFYANYMDIYDLADQIRDKLEGEVNALYEGNMYGGLGYNYLRLFRHIRENQLFYKTYFKLGYDRTRIDLKLLDPDKVRLPESHLEYHVEFHRAGLNAIIKKWLASGCIETPETMVRIIEDEYKLARG